MIRKLIHYYFIFPIFHAVRDVKFYDFNKSRKCVKLRRHIFFVVI